MDTLRFTSRSDSDPYRCNKPGDQSGEYYRKADVDAELERLNADRQLQAKLLLAAHKMLMSADLGPSSKDYLDNWAFIRDAELERLRADLAEAHATIASKILGFDAEVGDVFDAARVEMLHICAAIAVGQTPQKPAARTTAAADLLARVRAGCRVSLTNNGFLRLHIDADDEGSDLLRELVEALTGEN